MKKIYLAYTLLFSVLSFSQVGIGTTSPATSALLDVSSTTSGFLPPRMTLAQRVAILSPVVGLQIWCTDCASMGEAQIYNGTYWTNMSGRIAATNGVVPGAPTGLVATGGDEQVSIAFTAPIDNGGSAITGYTVTMSPGGQTATGTTSPIKVSGLTNGTSYTFTVIATNLDGNSLASTVSSAFTVPSVPYSQYITLGDRQASIFFSEPFNGGSAITGYTVTVMPGDLVVTGTTSPIVVTGLTAGSSYSVSLVATNAVGNSKESSWYITSYAAASAPTGLTAIAGNTQASVVFIAPVSNGNSAITSYTVTASPGGQTATGTASPLIVTGLTAGTAYTFTAVAINAAGNSATSTASIAVTPYSIADAPTGLTATAGYAQVSVAFTAPVSNGGSTITGYTVTAYPGGQTATGTTSPILVTGLTNGASYTFTAVATNLLGNSVASTASAAVTPYTIANTPKGLMATAGYTQASVAFTPPAFNGGSTITSYTVTASPGGQSVTGPVSPLVVIGLTAGTSYTFTTVATNVAGNSSASLASATVIPYTVPSAITTGITPTSGFGQISIAFPTPFNGYSTITSYTVTASPGGQTATGATSPLVVTGLTNGTNYSFSVISTNAAGNSSNSWPSYNVSPADLPSAPTGVSATAGNELATIVFTESTYSGESAITGYTVTASPEGQTVTGTASPLVVTGLTPGLGNTFTVVANSITGDSVASIASSAVIPYSVPYVPNNTIATAGNLQASVAFDMPYFDGYFPIIDYTVTASPGGQTVTGTASPLVVTGLTAGTSYTFTIFATNIIGNSATSMTSTVTTLLESGSAICDGSLFTDIIELTSATGRVWMDRNLGASRAGQSSIDYQAYGCLYQWGRGNDGHASVNWSSSTSGAPVNISTSNIANSDNPEHGLFIYYSSSTDWRSYNNNTRWQLGSQVNNPCPSGFYVPSDSEITAEYTQYAMTNAATAYANGPGTGFKFVLPGYRDNMTIVGTASSTHIWSNNVSGSNSLNRINTSDSSGSSSDYRNKGYSVRCIKD